MTDSVLLPGRARLSAQLVTDNSDAFRRAATHSLRVRRLRVSIMAGAVLLAAGVVGFAFLDPFRASVPPGVSIDGAGLSGSRITMAHPKMSGYRNDGKLYRFTAESAVQDLRQPNVLELNSLDAHVGMSDGTAHIKALVGLYDTSREIMDLKGDIRITSDSGTDISMRSAHVEFNGGNVSSSEPVNVAMNAGTVSSDAMRMTGNGADVTFIGHVHSLILPATAPALRAGE